MNWLAGQIILSYGWRRAAILFVAGVIAGTSVPPLFMLPALFVAFPIWIWALDGAETAAGWGRLFGPAFRIGFGFALGYFIVAFHWLGAAFFIDGGIMLAVMPFAILVLAATMALFWGLASAAAHLVWSGSPLRILALATSLSLAEFARGHVLTGFPFDLVGYALTANTLMMQAASFVGVYGLTFIAVLIAMTPALIWPAEDHPLTARLTPFFAALLLIAAQVGYGQYRLQSTPIDTTENVHLRLIQPNIDQAQKWQAESREFTVDRLIALSETQLDPTDNGLDDVSILIWPEAALPFFLSEYPEALARFARMLPSGTLLLTGAPRRDTLAEADYNAVLALNSEGEVIAAYDKQHLVPVGEFLPFKDLLAKIGLRQFVPGLTGWSHGTTPRLMQPDGSPPFIALVCYEAIFSGALAPQLDQADYILNVTNDGWFAGSIGPRQHFHHARLRAVETGLPMVRVANTGITALIDPLGQVLGQVAPDEMGVLDGDLPAKLVPPPFVRFGHLPFWIALVISAALVFAQRWRSTRRRGPT